MTKILVAEDDRDLNTFVSVSLGNYGYDVKSCFDGGQALEEWEKGKYDLLLTDIMMPRLDGFSLTQKLRSKGDQTPVIFMSAKDDKPSKMLGYNLGIDDYMTKPFDMDELIMKINAVLRRASIDSKKELTVGNFCMNLDERSASVDGKEISLTVREFDLLFKMLSYPKKTFTRSALMDEFWDYDSSATSRTVDVYMAKLREKTATYTGFEIVTVHGLGYKAVLK